MTEPNPTPAPTAPLSTPAPAAPSVASPSPTPTPAADSFITADPAAPVVAAPKVADPAVAAPIAIARPEWLPETLWDGEKGAKVDDIKSLLTDAETARAAKAALPKTPEEYKPEFPKDFKVPDGVKINAADPRLLQWQKDAHELGLSQEAFSRGLVSELNRVVALQANLKAAVKARDDALGPNGTARVDTLHGQIDAYFDAPVAADMKRMLVTPHNVAGMETIFAALAAQGVETLRRADGGGAPPAGKIPGYETMTTQQKFALADQRKAASR